MKKNSQKKKKKKKKKKRKKEGEKFENGREKDNAKKGRKD